MFSNWFWLVTLVCAVQIYAEIDYEYYLDYNKVDERAGGEGGGGRGVLPNGCYNCTNWTTRGISNCPNAQVLQTYLEDCITLVTKDSLNPCGYIVCDYNPSVDGCGKDGVKGTRMLCPLGTVWDDVKSQCVSACLKPGIVCPTIAPAHPCYTTKRRGGGGADDVAAGGAE